MADRLGRERAALLKREFKQGFTEYCGFEVEDIQWGKAESSLKVESHHRQQDGFVHAGVMATMADHTAGYAGFTTVDDNRRVLTVEFKINFLKPASGPRLICRSQVIRGGRNLIVVETEVYDAHGKDPVLCAKAMMTQMAVELSKG